MTAANDRFKSGGSGGGGGITAAQLTTATAQTLRMATNYQSDTLADGVANANHNTAPTDADYVAASSTGVAPQQNSYFRRGYTPSGRIEEYKRGAAANSWTLQHDHDNPAATTANTVTQDGLGDSLASASAAMDAKYGAGWAVPAGEAWTGYLDDDTQIYAATGATAWSLENNGVIVNDEYDESPNVAGLDATDQEDGYRVRVLTNGVVYVVNNGAFEVYDSDVKVSNIAARDALSEMVAEQTAYVFDLGETHKWDGTDWVAPVGKSKFEEFVLRPADAADSLAMADTLDVGTHHKVKNWATGVVETVVVVAGPPKAFEFVGPESTSQVQSNYDTTDSQDPSFIGGTKPGGGASFWQQVGAIVSPATATDSFSLGGTTTTAPIHWDSTTGKWTATAQSGEPAIETVAFATNDTSFQFMAKTSAGAERARIDGFGSFSNPGAFVSTEVFGRRTYATANSQTLMGYDSRGTGNGATAYGQGARAEAFGVGIGSTSRASSQGIAIGLRAEGIGSHAQAYGSDSEATTAGVFGSIAMGRQSIAGSGQFVVGSGTFRINEFLIGGDYVGSSDGSTVDVDIRAGGATAGETDLGGRNLRFRPGNATGNASPGDVVFSLAQQEGASGTALQTYRDCVLLTGNPGADETPITVLIGGALKVIKQDSVDSGGAGHRRLIVVN